MTTDIPRTVPAGRYLYPAAALLVILYVNTFEIWGMLVGALGGERAGLVPFAALVAALGCVPWLVRGRGPTRLRPGAVMAAAALIALGLLITDPAFPAKRIHVPQYLLLALVLRRALSDHVGGAALTGTAVLFALLFGIHDEMLQGLHPNRTYGLRDMAVNGVSGAAGALLAAGIGLWTGPAVPFRPDRRTATAAAALAGAVLFLVLQLVDHRGMPPPVWLGLPVLAAGLALLAAARATASGPAVGHAATALAWITLPLALYPVMPHVAPLVFN
ncbi:VanZ family protein [Skermanella mucosa]|uniref:VanZ family protein n=1 Tax=Skermanella mucosa TaxID=1789672 RepID=UPI00192C7576|nr:VanZ family protein [Skermanella mucosa]UEM21794.1 VanZ family protein [Skermanella mucosa]